jgi:hypothetical protein
LNKISKKIALPDSFAKKMLMVSMGGSAEGLVCVDLGVRSSLDASRNYSLKTIQLVC